MTTSVPGAPVDESRARLIRNLALAVGIVYTLVGLAGFIVTGFDHFASETGKTLLGFEINPLHNIVHLVIGVAGILLSRTLAMARTYGWLLVAGYGLAFIYGLFATGNSDINFLSLNWPDNWLHLVTVIVGLVLALLPVRARAGTAAGPRI